MYIPKLAFFGCVLPILIISLTCLFFYLSHRKNRGYYYYSFNQDIVFLSASLLITAILLPFLLGYSIASIYYIYVSHLMSSYIAFVIFLVFLPIVPLIMFFWLVIRIYKMLKLKKELDVNYDKIKGTEATK